MITLKKVKRKGEGLLINCQRTEDGRPYLSPGEIHPDPIHKKMVEAFEALRVHYACMFGFIQASSTKDPKKVKEEHLSDYRVNGYALSSKGDGIMLLGMIKAESGRWSSLNTPLTLFEQEENAYYFMDELQNAIKKLDERVLAYLNGTELGVSQGKLDLPEQSAEELAEEETEEAK